MTDEARLRIGVAEFSEPTLLLITDARGFRWLAGQIESRKEFTIAQTRGPQGSRVSIRFVPKKVGRLNRAGNAFTWAISQAEATQFADQLRQLSESGTPAHAYLDSEGVIPVVASLDEYDPEEVFRN